MGGQEDQATVGQRWAGSLAADHIEEPDPRLQFFEVDVYHAFEREPVELANGEVTRDAGHILVVLGGVQEHQFTLRLCEDQALRFAFLLQRAAGWVEDERSDPPDTQRQLERLTEAS
jgi:hypothetical protein